MISSKSDYAAYIQADQIALKADTIKPLLNTDNSMIWLTDHVFKWEKLLRKIEYWENCHHSVLAAPYRFFLRFRFQRLSAFLGFSIPLNVIGPGLSILHYGSIVISRHARIGRNCTLNSGVNIGANPIRGGAPIIGDDVYIGPGAKLWNDIVIADGVIIGANACVSKSVLTPKSTVILSNSVIKPSSGK